MMVEGVDVAIAAATLSNTRSPEILLAQTPVPAHLASLQPHSSRTVERKMVVANLSSFAAA